MVLTQEQLPPALGVAFTFMVGVAGGLVGARVGLLVGVRREGEVAEAYWVCSAGFAVVFVLVDVSFGELSFETRVIFAVA